MRRRSHFAPLFLALCACGSTAVPRTPEPASALGSDAGDPPPVQTAAAASRASADAGVENDPAARENRRIAKMVKRVAEARGLAPLKPVPGVVLARDALLANVKQHVEREVPPEVIQHEGLKLQLLGFVPETFDYLAKTFELLNAQLAGFYEPADGTMYMAADLDGPNAEATLAHELDHALQDQHFDLKPHSKYEPGKSDAQSAFDALAEGDATSAMADVMFAKAMPGKTALDIPEEMFTQNVLESVSADPSMDVPHIMRASLVAPYITGTIFVNALRRGGGWSAVDAAWNALPTTSEQILHVEKWRAHEPALDVPAPTFAALGAGFTGVDSDTNGELGLRIGFGEWVDDEAAKVAAVGWGGDREILVQNGDRAALALHVRYDANRGGSAKEEPFALLAPGIAAKVGKPAAKDANWVCVARAALGPLGVLRRGRELVIVAGPAKTGSTWAAAGDCALAKRWATEIAANGATGK
jgi:hypothetical protein